MFLLRRRARAHDKDLTAVQVCTAKVKRTAKPFAVQERTAKISLPCKCAWQRYYARQRPLPCKSA